MRPITLMHIADVHLGLAGLGVYGAEEHAFERAIDLAIDVAADGVLIVGDLFDHGRVSDDLLVWTAKSSTASGARSYCWWATTIRSMTGRCIIARTSGSAART